MILRQSFAHVCIYILVFHYDCCEGAANLQTNKRCIPPCRNCRATSRFYQHLHKE